MSTRCGVLLVHGAWYTGRAWDGVAAGLRARGVPVAVAELHRGSLAADIGAAERALDEVGGHGPAVVCGHSYGGAVISGMAPGRIRHLVYLAAIVLDAGETSMAALGGASDLMAALAGDPHGTTTIKPGSAGELFYAHLGPAARERWTALLVPQQMAAGYQQAASAAWRHVPSTYIVCDDDHIIAPEIQRRMAKRTGHAVSWHSDHGAFASRQDETVALLEALAIAPEPARPCAGDR